MYISSVSCISRRRHFMGTFVFRKHLSLYYGWSTSTPRYSDTTRDSWVMMLRVSRPCQTFCLAGSNVGLASTLPSRSSLRTIHPFEGSEVSCLANLWDLWVMLWAILAWLLITMNHMNRIVFIAHPPERISEQTMSREIIQALEIRSLNSSAYLRNAYCAYALRMAAQFKHAQKRSKYISTPHTPYPATIHACSYTITQKSWYSVRPRASSACGASGATYIPVPPVTACPRVRSRERRVGPHIGGLDGAGRPCTR